MSVETDRELLELAAKAAGIDGWYEVGYLTEKCVKPRPSGRGRKARSPLGLLWEPPINQQP